ncbi:MAG TPA: aldo/keto reductase [Vicinamibacterales bacterium]|nr:aldo/keto reductase [Vicinamibacterales bacterium]
MINRREFIGITAGAGALALTPELLRAFEQSAGTLMQRAIPSSGERLPVISFAPRPPVDPAGYKEVLKTLLDNGGKVVDVLHGGPAVEDGVRAVINELGIQNRIFCTTPLNIMPAFVPGAPPPKPDPAATKAALEEKLAKFKASKIDLVLVSAAAAVDEPGHLAFLRQMKKEGRVRYIGVHELLFPPNMPSYPYPPTSKLEAVMRNEQIDFIATDYSVGDRRLEETILPLAQEKKIAAMAYFPFDRGRIFQRASSTPLPEWAAEFDAKTWAQFFIKYALSHPAITVVRTGTTKPAHMLENINAGMGRVPNEAMRKRMAQLVDSLPPTPPPGPPPEIKLPPAVLDRYVGEYTAASGFTAIFRRDGDKLIVKPGNNPETPLMARSQTRFQDPRGPFFEFELDAQGKVLRVFLDQQGPNGVQRIVLQRK